MTMRTLTLSLAAGLAALAVAVPGGPARAQSGDLSLSANTALVTDYRFRGLSLSDEDVAIQGGLDAGYQGFYAGTWASSIDEFNGAETELDVYAGWSGDMGGVTLDIGGLGYLYPGGTDTNYYEIYASVGGEVQSIGWTVGAAYAPDQDNIGDDDNIYVYGDLSYSIPDSPFYVGGHFGLEDGALGGDNKLDWSISLGVAHGPWDVSVSYIDTDVAGTLTDATAVVSVGASF